MLSHKRPDFRKKKMLLNTKCVFLLSPQLLSENFSFYEELNDIPNMYLHVKRPLFLFDFNET